MNDLSHVIVALGNAALFGQEHKNIEVSRAACDAGVDALFVTHAACGHRTTEPYLHPLRLEWERLCCPWHLRYGLPRREWISNVARLATVPTLVDGLQHSVTTGDSSLAASGASARASLADLGGTHEQFAAAWRRICNETARVPYAAA